MEGKPFRVHRADPRHNASVRHLHEHIGVVTVLWGCLAMAAKDCINTFLVVAENRGRAWLAGLLDGAGDLAVVLVNVIGAGSVVIDGWTPQTITILAAMMVTSVIGTYFWTRLAQHIGVAS